MALGNGSPPPARGECVFYSSFTLRNPVATLVIYVRWYQDGRARGSLPFWSRLRVETSWELGKIPPYQSFSNEFCSLFNLCRMKDNFSMASIGGFRKELFLKIPSLSFEKKLRASCTFPGFCKEG